MKIISQTRVIKTSKIQKLITLYFSQRLNLIKKMLRKFRFTNDKIFENKSRL